MTLKLERICWWNTCRRFFRQDTFVVFSYLTIALSLVFGSLLHSFLARILQSSLVVSLFSLFLFQEIYIDSYYPNSTIISAGFIMLACLLITFKEKPALTALAGLLFAAAIWARFDAILLGLAFIVLIMTYQKKQFIRAVLIFGGAFLMAGFLLAFLSDFSIANLVNQYGAHASKLHIEETLISYSTIFSFAVIFFRIDRVVLSLSAEKNGNSCFLSFFLQCQPFSLMAFRSPPRNIC